MDEMDEGEKASDYANYFCSYAYLYHQKQMLMDHTRMRSYYSAIMGNKSLFEDKIVLDIGAGSGVLSLWAAKAGAKKVYAVEFTDMAKFAKQMVDSNELSEVVEVLQTSVEEMNLPGQVDIIISEWMGYLLLRESMLDSVIQARDKWLKPTGSMFPSHATVYFAPISFEEDRVSKTHEYLNSMDEWNRFKEEMSTFYDLKMEALEEAYDKEQADYYIYSSLWTELRKDHVIGEPVPVKYLDLNTCTLEDSEGIDKANIDFQIDNRIMSGLAGWFTVDFKGSEAMPCVREVTLSTGPEVGYTHWGQQVFYLKDMIDSREKKTRIHGNVTMFRQKKNKRLYNCKFEIGTDDNEELNTSVYEVP